ncbi:MAG: ATP-binding protein [Eubacteriales bacterium]
MPFKRRPCNIGSKNVRSRWHYLCRAKSCKIIATGSASPVLVAHSSESGVGRWTIIKISTLSFYEYCELVGINDLPQLPSELKPSQLATLSSEKLEDLMRSLAVLQKYFHRYLLVGGFPEIALSDDVPFAQRILREDVIDKVLKRDLIVLFNVRNVAELEKVFLYLCIHSGGLITIDTIAKEIGGVARQTVSNYLNLLEAANLIYISNPVEDRR